MKRNLKVHTTLAVLAASVWLGAASAALADDDGGDRDDDGNDDDPNVPIEKPELIELRSFAYAGTGCPANSVTANIPVEGTSFVIGWEPFTAAEFAAGSDTVAWPASLPLQSGATYALVGGGDPARRQMTLRVLDRLPADEDLLAELAGRGCRYQFEVWVREKVAAGKRKAS